MKILQVASSLYEWGGIERYVCYLAQGMTAKGHEVTVACPKGSPLALKLGMESLDFRIRRKFDPRAFRRYTHLFRNEDFDIVHIHFGPDFLAAGMAARMARGPKVVLTRHVAVPWSRLKTTHYLDLFDHIIPVSEAVREVLLESGVPPKRMTVAKAGCPPLLPTRHREAVRQDLGIEGFTAGVFGRLVQEKGVDVAIQAAARIDISLQMFGDGPEREALSTLAPHGKIKFHGFVKDVSDPMHAVDAVVIPSRWAEAFPFSALEAMSIGKPIVAAATGGIPELIEDGETGLLFRVEDVKGLAECLTRILTDEDLARRLCRNAQEKHAREFTVPAMAERIEAVYKEILATT